MSVKVTTAVWDHSRAQHSALLVLLKLADHAEEGSGIAFPPIVDREDTPPHRRRSLCAKTKLSEREVRNSIRELEELGEIETRQAQRGRARVNVYRVRVGYLAERDAEIGDLPFKLLEPFSTTGNLCRQSDSATGGNPRSELPAIHDADHRQSTTSTTGTRNRAKPHQGTASAVEPSVEPPEGPAAEPKELSLRAVTQPAEGSKPVEEPAAASESEPASIEHAVVSLAKLTGWDTGSLAVVMPLVQQIPATVFVETLTKTIARKANNQPGMLVHLLRIAIGDWRQSQHDARLASWDQFFGEAGLERVKRDDPDGYVLAWATPALEAARPLPPALVVEHVLEYVHAHTADKAERDRLLQLFIRKTDRIPSALAVKSWILKAIDQHDFTLDDVLAAVETFTADDLDARESLFAFAREVQANVERERADRAA